MSEQTESVTSASQSADKSRMLSIIAVSLVALMVLLIALVFWRMIAIGRDAATAYSSKPSKTASAPASTAAKNPNAKKTPTMTLKEGREKLSLLTDNSLCQGETDADFLVEFARLSEEAGQWERDKGQVNARLKELPEKCGEVYTTSLANRLRSASTPKGLAELVNTTLAQAGGARRPAPSGAIDIEDFYTPSGNIQCAYDSAGLSCTISQYDYASECQGSPTTYSINYEGTTSQSCGAPAKSDSGIAYNTTVSHGGVACTITQDGVECWHEGSAKGFKLARSGVSTF